MLLTIVMEDESKTISFRVSVDEYKQIERIAGILSDNKQIRNNRVGSLARAFLFVKVNEFLQVGQTQKTLDEREEALKARNVRTQGHGYL
jgi:hypothetical protein